MRLVTIGKEGAAKSAKKSPRPHRITAYYSIRLKCKILSPAPSFPVLRRFSRDFAITKSTRRGSEKQTTPVMRKIAGNSDILASVCRTETV